MFAPLFDALSHQNLSVATIAANVSEHYHAGNVVVVTSEVASGKTLLLPATFVDHLSDTSDIIYVVEPSRALANNAADTMRRLLGPADADLVGVLNSSRSGDESITHDRNRIIFTTVGFALGAGIIRDAKYIVIDEAHDLSIDMSLTKAILRYRLSNRDPVHVAVLSATIDVEDELDFWDVSGGFTLRSDPVPQVKHFTTAGSSHPVEYVHNPVDTIGACVLDLIEVWRRKGLLVFVSGKQEIEDAIEDIKDNLKDIPDVEIRPLHGMSDPLSKQQAFADPEGDIKILVATNVIESGVSIPWVDGGVSSGKTKVLNVHNNVHKLQEEELPAWRIAQQMGRVGRFGPGVFILNDGLAWDQRPDQSVPDIRRLPLTEMVLHCASFGLNPLELVFSKKEQPKTADIFDAVSRLSNYGLIYHSGDGSITLTEDGRRIRRLPLSFKSSVAFCESVRMGKADMMLPLIASLEVGDIRYSHRAPLGGVHWGSSDVVKQVLNIVEFFRIKEEEGYTVARDWAVQSNINTKKIFEAEEILSDLENKLGIDSNITPYTDRDFDKTELDLLTKQVLFRAYFQEIYAYSYGYVNFKQNHAVFSSTAEISKMSAVSHGYGRSADIVCCSGELRSFTTKSGNPHVVLDQVTVFTMSDIEHFIRVIGTDLIDMWSSHMNQDSPVKLYKDKLTELEYRRGLASSDKAPPESAFEYNGRNTTTSRHENNQEGSLADVLRSAGIGLK